MEVAYDHCGRMKYNPEFHENHGKDYTIKELAYICQNYKWGNRKTLSMAVGRTEATLASLVYKLKKDGEFERYKNMNIEG